jgi:hypothetical protein
MRIPFLYRDRLPVVRGRALPALVASLAIVAALLGVAAVAAQPWRSQDTTSGRAFVRSKAGPPGPSAYAPSPFKPQARDHATYIEPL